jgi:8-oxo-dGTP pyrophosphatase MutT (NUDIX family)
MLRRVRVLAFRVVGRMPRWLRRFLVHSVAPSFTVGAMCLITRADGAQLLVRHSYRNGWGVPGGLLKRGEEAADGALRECMEETGLAIVLDHPPTVVVDPGARRVDVIFTARPRDETATDVHARSAELLEARWFQPQEMPTLQHETAKAMGLVAQRP